MIKSEKICAELSARFDQLEKLMGDSFNRRDFYFAGGCIYSLWNGKEPKDYDIFCKNKRAMQKLEKWFREHKGVADIITKNAISMGNYQFVTRHIGAPREQVALFDFLHNCYWYDEGRLHALNGWSYLDDTTLHFNSARARDILNIMTRIPKFVSRGMTISQNEMLRILEEGTRPTRIMKERRYIRQRKNGRFLY